MSIDKKKYSLNIIQMALWNAKIDYVNRNTYDMLVTHSIIALPAPILSQIPLSDELRKEWNRKILQQISYNTQCVHMQKYLPITVPYVILKGTSAAKYYPHPEYRTLGDIDIMTRREDFDQAYRELIDGGYTITQILEREISFKKNGITVELHRYFASLNDPKQAKYLDDLIIDNINPSHVLPDEINGLVLLEHINQHLENGLGLRQIIDWMMFVDKCLPDDNWHSFRTHADAIGLETMAIAVTRMCEIYLGLSYRQWCSNANEKLCEQLMDYIMACGNFGNIRGENISIGENVFYISKTQKSLFTLLQDRGMANWKAAQEHVLLKPFAWLYQALRYLVKGLNRDDAYQRAKREYKSAKQRNKMFEELGAKQAAKGLAVYRNGEYIKR